MPKKHRYFIVIAAFSVIATCVALSSADETPRNPEPQWWKGNIHTHSLWSDGNDFPDMIADWYQSHDYNFLALSDHNILSQGQRWMGHAAIIKRGGKDVVNKYVNRFGTDWVETRDAPNSESPNNEGDYEIRLKPFSEYRALVEERGKFLMMPAEEISDSVGGLPVHMNATNLQELIQPLSGETVSAAIEANMRAVNEQAKRLGREVIVHLNHPNFGYGVTAEDLAHAISEKFFEVYNGHTGVNQPGDESHPSIEQLWDIANTIRLGQLDAAPLYGVATDDSHHYHGGQQSPGRGWIMVRATHLTPESLIRAMKRGEFYASTGVRINNIRFESTTNELTLEIDDQDGIEYTTTFVGSKKDAIVPAPKDESEDGEEGDSNVAPTSINAEKVGAVFSTVKGPNPSFQLTGDELYVRAIVTSSRNHPNPSLDGQKEMAWTQPVGWSVDR